jgi:hypothetical protein
VNKKIIVHELLILWCFLLFGFVLLPAVISVLEGESISQFYKALAVGKLYAWGLSCSPYVIYLLVRSIVWAVKSLKPKGGL